MNDILRKLTSRKFIMALLGMAIGAGMALGVEGSEIVDMVALIGGVLTAAGSAITYIRAEAKVDAAAAAKGGEEA